ncbi:MAG: DNA-binding protein [Gammaproteobacteria bacterium]|nr:DNA-binding protein [Gammaproteobacteria bacterium]
MGRTGITYLDVSNAISTIQGNQKNPTVDAIREELKTGSRSTIAKYFQEWKTKNGVKNVTDTGIPNELQNLIQALWEKIQSDADKRIEEHQAKANAEINEAKNSIALTQNQNALLHDEIKKLSEKLDVQASQLMQLENTLQSEKNNNLTLQQRNIAQDWIISDQKKANEELHQHLKNTQDNLMHYQNSIEQQRQEQMLSLENERSKYAQLQNELNITSQDKISYQTRLENLNDTHNKLLADFDYLKSSNHSVQQAHDSLLSENREFKNTIQRLETIENQLSLSLENKNKENTDLYIQVKTLQNNEMLAKTASDTFEKTIHHLEEQLEKTRQEKYFLEAKIKAEKLTLNGD